MAGKVRSRALHARCDHAPDVCVVLRRCASCERWRPRARCRCGRASPSSWTMHWRRAHRCAAWKGWRSSRPGHACRLARAVAATQDAALLMASRPACPAACRHVQIAVVASTASVPEDGLVSSAMFNLGPNRCARRVPYAPAEYLICPLSFSLCIGRIAVHDT